MISSPAHALPSGPTETAFTPSPGELLPHQLVAAIAQHRLATTAQLHALLRPAASRQTISYQLNRLRRQLIVDHTVLPQSNRSRAWFLTPEGARVTRDWPQLRGRPPYPITSASAASLKTPHTLTVLRAHLVFIADARQRGDEHGYLDWTPEVSHPLGEGERVIADALMHYVLHTPEGGPNCARWSNSTAPPAARSSWPPNSSTTHACTPTLPSHRADATPAPHLPGNAGIRSLPVCCSS